MPWTIKYKPRKLKEIVNQKIAVEVFLKWVKGWKPGDKALLFHGAPGTGKTALIEAYANENCLEFIEMNASDFRSADQIREVLGQSMRQRPLFKKGKIFLLDEVDGLAGRQDFGGPGEIIKIIEESQFPVVLSANNPWEQKLRALRQHCQLVEFKKISAFEIERKLGQICEIEGKKVDKLVLKQLASMADGDLRSAISDLETLSQGKSEIRLLDLESIGYRERETNIFDALKIIFKTRTVSTARSAMNNLDKEPDEVFWWIENNIANEYERPDEIAKAFDALSRADIFKKRISERQDWKLMAYMIDLMTAGVATAKHEMYRKFTRYQYPSKIAVLGSTKQMRQEEKTRLIELAKQLHCSMAKVRKEFLPYLKIISE